jgi:hypothetical protein
MAMTVSVCQQLDDTIGVHYGPQLVGSFKGR